MTGTHRISLGCATTVTPLQKPSPKAPDQTARTSPARTSPTRTSRARTSPARTSRARLTGATLTGAIGVRAPIIPNIDAAILAAIEAPGCALEMANWHSCNTTHCRAGWAVHLCGDAGYALEDRVGSAAAGALIYAASRPGVPVPNFYSTNKDAMADIRKHAKAQAEAKDTP